MKDKRDIFEFEIDKRPDGTKVVNILIKLENERRFFLGFLTDYQIDELIKLRKEL